MKNGIFTLAFIAIILGTQCQESAPKSSDFNTQLSTEIGNLNTARQTVVDANNQVNDLRTELNNIPEDVKADPNSGFSELLRKVEIFESKTGAMLMMYDRVIPEPPILIRICKAAASMLNKPKCTSIPLRLPLKILLPALKTLKS